MIKNNFFLLLIASSQSFFTYCVDIKKDNNEEKTKIVALNIINPKNLVVHRYAEKSSPLNIIKLADKIFPKFENRIAFLHKEIRNYKEDNLIDFAINKICENIEKKNEKELFQVTNNMAIRIFSDIERFVENKNENYLCSFEDKFFNFEQIPLYKKKFEKILSCRKGIMQLIMFYNFNEIIRTILIGELKSYEHDLLDQQFDYLKKILEVSFIENKIQFSDDEEKESIIDYQFDAFIYDIKNKVDNKNILFLSFKKFSEPRLHLMQKIKNLIIMLEKNMNAMENRILKSTNELAGKKINNLFSLYQYLNFDLKKQFKNVKKDHAKIVHNVLSEN